MRIQFDRELCAGHARCAAVAPDVYPLDDFGYCCVENHELSADLEKAARSGAAACPEGAIEIVE